MIGRLPWKRLKKNDQNKYGCDADGCWCLTAADAGCQSFLNWIIDWLINFFCYIRLLLLLLSFGIGLCSIYTVLSSFKRESSQALATGWITLAIELFIIFRKYVFYAVMNGLLIASSLFLHFTELKKTNIWQACFLHLPSCMGNIYYIYLIWL